LIGMGERTRPAAAELYATRLFAAGAAQRVIAVVLPPRRSSMHLDTVMTMVDRDAFTIYPELRDTLVGYTLTLGQSGLLNVEREEDLSAAIARALDVPALRLFETGGDRYESEREQWDDGNNVLAIAAGVGGRLRAQRRHQHPPAARRHRGDHDRRGRARPRSRRTALHVLPNRARRAPRRQMRSPEC
jgi:hypothetical protein